LVVSHSQPESGPTVRSNTLTRVLLQCSCDAVPLRRLTNFALAFCAKGSHSSVLSEFCYFQL